ncbi:hypothetical protein TWF594_001032 [Orbilia oligospora]|nr:hypothetical protein TWF594_001032 [Orbilia oligospora]
MDDEAGVFSGNASHFHLETESSLLDLQMQLYLEALLARKRCLGRATAYNPITPSQYLVQPTWPARAKNSVLDYPTVGKNFTNSPSGASPGQISPIKIGMDHVIGIQAKSPHTTGLTRSFSQPQVARKMLKFKRKGDTPVESLVHVL